MSDKKYERWLPVPGYEGHYDVSDRGQVRSLKHSPRILKPGISTTGYQIVILCLNGRNTWKIHRLVLLAFAGPLPKDSQIRHLDGNKMNNVSSNLAYGTRSENNLDRVRHGTDHNANKTQCPKGHPYDEANTYTRILPNWSSRFCRVCRREKNRIYRTNKKLLNTKKECEIVK